MTGGRVKASRKRQEGEGQIFFENPQSAILTFSHSFFYDLNFTNEFSCIGSRFSIPNLLHRSRHVFMNHEIFFDINTFIATIVSGNRRFSFCQL